MIYCKNCGQPIEDEASFCTSCGTPVKKADSSNERKTVYDGEIHKCPHCGEILKAFQTKCICGYELRGAKIPHAVKEFCDGLSTILNEREKIQYIKTYGIPNTKEDIFEFMLLAASNFDATYYATHLEEEDISDAWLIMINRCYEKAKKSLSVTDFNEIELKYNTIKNNCKKQARLQEEEKQEKMFKKSKLRIFLIISIIISAIVCAGSFGSGSVWSGVIAAVMTGLFIVAYLMGCNIIRVKVKKLKIIPIIIAFLLYLPCTALNTMFIIMDGEEFSWSDIVLNSVLPQPTSNYGKIIINSEEELYIGIYKISEADYKKYVNTCKEAGFMVDSETMTDSYEAYNDSGFKLEISYYDFNKEYRINLNSPTKRNDIFWENIDIINQLPTPISNIGEIIYENDSSFSAYVLNINKQDYNNYVNACIECGFNIQYSKNEDSFYGDNESGYTLTLKYEGFNTMYIRING